MEANCLSRNSMERKIIRNNIHKWLLQVNEKKTPSAIFPSGQERNPAEWGINGHCDGEVGTVESLSMKQIMTPGDLSPCFPTCE